ncbi:HNH endonuclease signature motif containing protein [Zhihengliuella flava]|uniref:5-methylcytosine-specific restriction endonuclease McrA n=1 Tax=Zhihengliuella flava TaxID=1285193 RepID=A0A931GD92_9MICC|nr:5-methylcytosine-specific restriction endonuclease McrA [Zhihengliuella flava]
MSGPNIRRANGSARTKLRKRVIREESICWLCGKPVDKSLPHGLPGSPEVDEIVPVSKGGSPLERDNVRLAHRICNQRRGNKDPDAVRQRAPAASRRLRTSRRW